MPSPQLASEIARNFELDSLPSAAAIADIEPMPAGIARVETGAKASFAESRADGIAQPRIAAAEIDRLVVVRIVTAMNGQDHAAALDQRQALGLVEMRRRDVQPIGVAA